MLERLDLMKEGQDRSTGKKMRRYRAIINCVCRRRLDHITVLANLVHATRQCDLCRQSEEVDLTKAIPFAAEAAKHAPFYQDTRCRECGTKFSFSFDQQVALEVSCPSCHTLTRKRRKVA